MPQRKRWFLIALTQGTIAVALRHMGEKHSSTHHPHSTFTDLGYGINAPASLARTLLLANIPNFLDYALYFLTVCSLWLWLPWWLGQLRAINEKSQYRMWFSAGPFLVGCATSLLAIGGFQSGVLLGPLLFSIWSVFLLGTSVFAFLKRRQNQSQL